MSEDIKIGSAPIPPRVTIKAPDAVEPPASATASDGGPVLKKKTARIALDQVTAESGAPATTSNAGLTSKTIRLAPAMTGQVVAAPLPAVGKALTGILVSDDVKRKTSRISLEAVLPQLESAGAEGGDSGPKTIRIKRPAISAPSIMPSLSEEAPAPVVSPDVNLKSQTARVDLPPEPAANDGQQTQKKTIKIRRADGGGPEVKAAPRSVSISRSEAASAVPVQVQIAQPHWAFVLVAAAAVIVMCVMIYALLAQAVPSLGWSLG